LLGSFAGGGGGGGGARPPPPPPPPHARIAAAPITAHPTSRRIDPLPALRSPPGRSASTRAGTRTAGAAADTRGSCQVPQRDSQS